MVDEAPADDILAMDEALPSWAEESGRGRSGETPLFWRADFRGDGGRLGNFRRTAKRHWAYAKAWLYREDAQH